MLSSCHSSSHIPVPLLLSSQCVTLGSHSTHPSPVIQLLLSFHSNASA
ncbi:hypothetical protein HET73_03600 [Wolbachia endosymbiont of Atemnus politus]|nr:hypothetical protein [Wolbachia endosymbiont of Atemnus politus]NSM56578.1 hypothetical protein [Wolbachia endosymbiont of Atemnus politus]